jgi:hypothetical protein
VDSVTHWPQRDLGPTAERQTESSLSSVNPITQFSLLIFASFFLPLPLFRADARTNQARMAVEKEMERRRHMQVLFDEEERMMERKASYRVSREGIIRAL